MTTGGGARAGGNSVARRATKAEGAGGADAGVRSTAGAASARHSGHSAQSGPRWSRCVGELLSDAPAWQIGIVVLNAACEGRAVSGHPAAPIAI